MNIATVNERRMRMVIIVLAVGHLAMGLWQIFSPATFYKRIGGFGPYNDHYIRDVATFYLAFGLVLLGSAQRIAWRVPILLFGVAQYAFHFLNHLFDIGDSHPGWVGPVDAVSLLVLLAVFVWALRSLRPRTGRARLR
jgi:hypothetical protein